MESSLADMESSLAMGVRFNAWAARTCATLTYLDQLCTAGVFASEVLSLGSVESMMKAIKIQPI